MVVTAPEDPSRRLAERLRDLRKRGLPGARLTQEALAEALGVSPPAISSWETANAAVPADRLDSYARFFATEKSITKRPFRLLSASQLNDEERQRYTELLQELTRLRDRAEGQQPASAPTGDPYAASHWRFPPRQDITIVCSALPADYLAAIPYTDPKAPDYVDLYRYADLDALLELHGHIRAANPLNEVHLRTPAEVTRDDFTSHLVLLGGVDWNTITAEILARLNLPVRQLGRASEDEPGGFVVDDGGKERMFSPVLRKAGGKERLFEDVAHFFRAVSPLNEKRTVTICSGMYQRGTYGAVRALTDVRFRDRNEQHLRERFAGEDTFSIISRVKVVAGEAVTPDWTTPDGVLHEWPERVS